MRRYHRNSRERPKSELPVRFKHLCGLLFWKVLVDFDRNFCSIISVLTFFDKNGLWEDVCGNNLVAKFLAKKLGLMVDLSTIFFGFSNAKNVYGGIRKNFQVWCSFFRENLSVFVCAKFFGSTVLCYFDGFLDRSTALGDASSQAKKFCLFEEMWNTVLLLPYKKPTYENSWPFSKTSKLPTKNIKMAYFPERKIWTALVWNPMLENFLPYPLNQRGPPDLHSV